MKKIILLVLCLSLTSCTFIYDSRDQNALDAVNPSYKLISADKAVFKTGRLIVIEIMKSTNYGDSNVKKKLNNKAAVWYAILWLTPATSMFVEGGVLLTGAAYLLRHSHRERKAIEFCMAEGFTQYICENNVKTMTRAEILDYIRDDEKVTREFQNRGIFASGKMIQ